MLNVTAIIPSHQHGKWLNQAIDSVVTQDYPHKRVVVVDNGSTDGSFEEVVNRLDKLILPKVQGEPSVAMGLAHGVEVMVQSFAEPLGPSFARNWGMKVGWEGADLFAFLDSDDLYEPGKISKSVAHFENGGLDYVGVVYSDYQTLRPDGLKIVQHKEPYSRNRLLRECIINCDSVVSKRAIETVGDFDEGLRVTEDYDLWLRLSERFVAIHIPQTLLTIRVGAHSSTTTVKSEVWKACWARVQQKLQERSCVTA